MKTFQDIEAMVLEMPGTVKDYPFGEDVAVYFVEQRSEDRKIERSKEATESANTKEQRKMFALIGEASMPVRISLKCDPQLAELLREKYESVLPGYHLNKKHWNTVICSGQLDDDELKDLIRHSYELVKGN